MWHKYLQVCERVVFLFVESVVLLYILDMKRAQTFMPTSAEQMEHDGLLQRETLLFRKRVQQALAE